MTGTATPGPHRLLSMAWPLALTALIAVGLFASKPKPRMALAE